MDKQVKLNVVSNTKGLDDIDNKLQKTGIQATNLFSQIHKGAKKVTNSYTAFDSVIGKTTKSAKAQATVLTKVAEINSKQMGKGLTADAKAYEASQKAINDTIIKGIKERISEEKKAATFKRKEFNAEHIAAKKLNTQKDAGIKKHFDNMHKEAILTEKQIQKQKALVKKTRAKYEAATKTIYAKRDEETQAVTGKDIAGTMQQKKIEQTTKTESTRIKKLQVDTIQYDAILKSLNLTRDKEGNIIDKTTKKLLSQRDVSKQMGIRHKQLSGLMEGTKKTQIPMEQLENRMRNIGLVMKKDGTYFDSINNKGISQTNVVEQLNKKYQQFNMNALGIMFFGMSIARTFNSMLSPAIQSSGAMEEWSYIMSDLFAPAGNLASTALEGVSDWADNRSEGFKTVISGLALAGSGLGTALSTTGQMMLGIGAIRTEFPKAYKALKKMAGWFDIAKIKTNLSSMATWINTKLTNSNTKAIGLNSTATNTKLIPSLAKGRAGMMSTSAVMYTMILPILLIIAAVALLSLAWKNNWGGIRQKTGETLIWFSGVYEKYIKPVFSLIISGVLFLTGMFTYTFTNLKTTLIVIMDSLAIIVLSIYNKIIGFIESGINKLINLIAIPIKLANSLRETQIEIPEMNLTSYKASLDELKADGAEAANALTTSWDTMITNTSNQVRLINKDLDAFTETIIGTGIKAIESGERFDMEKAHPSTVNNNTFTTEINVNEISSDMDVNEITNKINEGLGKLSDQRWTQ